jgi:uncharacterized protein with FMN-binding domain
MSRPLRPLAIALGLAGMTGALAGCTAPVEPADPAEHRYTDGTYVAEGGYTAPSGLAAITVSITVSDDAVSWVHVAPGTFVGDPFTFQDQFAKAVPDLVLGKDLDEVSVSRVAGSSLTSEAFNRAIDKIKTEAVEP